MDYTFTYTNDTDVQVSEISVSSKGTDSDPTGSITIDNPLTSNFSTDGNTVDLFVRGQTI